MNILLTGASGFIGQALLPQLLRDGHQVTLLSRQPTSTRPISVFEIIAQPENWATAVSGKPYHLCLHLAWIATPGIYLESPENLALAEATKFLAETLFQAGLNHFIGLGTCIEYAPDQIQPCTENHTLIAPCSAYGQAKEQARVSISQAAKKYGGSYTWVRLFYPYGEGEHPNRIPSSFLRTLANHQSLTLKTPDSTKDWIEIRDVVSALIHLAEKSPGQQEINLGNGVGTSMTDFAKITAHVVNANRSQILVSNQPAIDPYSYHVADTSKLLSTGWRPSVNLEQGLQSLYTSHSPNKLYP
jgi:nucleoside-diphosphate-sugar epimerase